MKVLRLCILGLLVLAITPLASAQKAGRSSAIDWQTLAEFLPDSVTGFVAGEAKGGSRDASDPNDSSRQVSFSSVRRNYIRETPEGEQSFIAVTIADAGRSKIGLEPFLPVLSVGDAGGDEETIDVKGRKASQLVEYGESDIALGVIYVRLGERMLVVVQGEGIREISVLQGVAAMVDYDALEKLKGGK